MKLSFDVLGTPVPQGSMKAFKRGKYAVVVHDKGGTLMDWRSDIARSGCGRGYLSGEQK